MKKYAVGSLPRRLTASYRELSYQAYIPYAWYSADSAQELAKYATTALHAVDDALAGCHDEALVAQERDGAARLLCNWRYKGMFPFPYVKGDELIISNKSQAVALYPHMKRLAAVVLDALNAQLKVPGAVEQLRATPYPINKGKGGPFFVPGSAPVAAYPLTALTLGCKTAEGIRKRCFAIGAKLEPFITLYVRIQAAKKRRAVWTADVRGEPQSTGAEAFMAKVRKVQGYPFLYNVALAETGAALLASMRAVRQPLLLPTLAQATDLATASSGQTMYAEDVSNFDDSVGVETWNAAVDLLVEPAIKLLHIRGVLSDDGAALALDVTREAGDMPIMIPPLSYNEDARRLDRKGAVPSGVRLTSVLGTFINAARIAASLQLVGVKPAWYMAFGDDTLIAFASTKDRRAYESSADWREAATGFGTTNSDDTNFLMRRMPQGYGYLSRMLLSTLQKERHLEPRSMMASALGVAARKQILTGNPLAHVYDRLVGGGALGDRLAASYALAQTAGFRADLLANVALAGVSMTASDSHTKEEILFALEDVYGEDFWVEGGLGSNLGGVAALRQYVESVKPPVSSLRAVAQEQYGMGDSVNLDAIASDLASWRT